MSDTETVINGLSDSDALIDNEYLPVGERAPQRKPTHTASIARAVNSALCEKPNTTHQRKLRTPRFTISPPTSQTCQTVTDASKLTAWSVETPIEWNIHFERLKFRLDNVEEARKKDQKKMEVMMEMIMQLQDEGSWKRKVGEDVGRAEESSKRLKKRTCIEEFGSVAAD